MHVFMNGRKGAAQPGTKTGFRNWRKHQVYVGRYVDDYELWALAGYPNPGPVV